VARDNFLQNQIYVHTCYYSIIKYPLQVALYNVTFIVLLFHRINAELPGYSKNSLLNFCDLALAADAIR